MKVIKKISLFLILILLNFNTFLASRGGQDLILPGSWVYDALLTLELEMGRVTFGDQAPVSINELKTYLNDINYDRLSDVGKKQYDRITDYISEKNFSWNAGIFSFGTEPKAALEGYYKSSDDIDWVYDYTKRNSMIDLPMKIGVGDYCTVFMGLTFSQSYYARCKATDNYCNQFFVNDAFDPALTHENYLSAGYLFNDDVGFNIRFGSGTQSLGHSLMPSIVMSEYMTDTPYFNLRLFSPIFNYNLNITQFTHSTYLYTHRIEARFFKKVQLSFIEGVLPYSHFDLRFVNPFAVFHGYGLFNEFSGECSSYFGMKISYVPVKYLRLYFLYSQNEHTMASEGEGDPEGNGFQIGLEGYVPGKEGYWHFGAEFFLSNPYMFIKESPNVSFAKVFNEMLENSEYYYQWMGSPLGPDTIAFQIAAGYEKPDAWSVDLAYTFAAKGEFSSQKLFKNLNWYKKDLSSFNESEWPYTDSFPADPSLHAPHGTPEYVNTISVKGSYKLADWMTIVFQPSYTFIFNYNNITNETRQGLELVLSLRFEFCKIPHGELKSPDFLFKDGKE